MNRPQRLARRQESRSAAYYGATQTPKSGSGDIKGDAYTDTELFEFKHTERQSFGIKLTAFMQHVREALLAHRRPVWEIEFTDPSGRHPHYLVVLDRDDYRGLTRAVEIMQECNDQQYAELVELRNEREVRRRIARLET